MTLTDFDKLTPAQRACIKKYKCVTRQVMGTDGPKPVSTVEIELHDPLKALQALGRHLGIFREKAVPQPPCTIILDLVGSSRRVNDTTGVPSVTVPA